MTKKRQKKVERPPPPPPEETPNVPATGQNGKKFINWERVSRYLQAGCSQKMIASSIGIDRDILRKRCFLDNGIEWAEYAAGQRDVGDKLLLVKLFDSAMNGNTQILLKLAAIRLGMVEVNEKEKANNQDEITIDHQNMLLKHQTRLDADKIAEMQKELNELKGTTDGNECNAGQELYGGDAEVQHMDRSGEQREDARQRGEATVRPGACSDGGCDDNRGEPHFYSAEYFDSSV